MPRRLLRHRSSTSTAPWPRCGAWAWPLQDNNAPAIALVSQLSTLDQGRVVAVRVLQQSGHFNAVMRDEISSAKVSDRYTEIIRAFDSIRDDASAMVEQVRDGRIDMGERLQNLWMKVTRGDIPSRFEKIRRAFLEVSRDSAEQLQRESRVLEMYGDFRLSIRMRKSRRMNC